MAQNSQKWSDFGQKRLKKSNIRVQVRFSRCNQPDNLLLQNVFSRNLVLHTLDFKFEFVSGYGVPFRSFSLFCVLEVFRHILKIPKDSSTQRAYIITKKNWSDFWPKWLDFGLILVRFSGRIGLSDSQILDNFSQILIISTLVLSSFNCISNEELLFWTRVL